MADEKQQIAEFWAWFLAHEPEFSRLGTPNDPFWDLALKQIKKVDEHFWFDLSRDKHPAREFIVTAEGHVNSFSTAEELVRLAPKTEGWTFVALKPAQGFHFTTSYEGILFDPSQMWFVPLESTSRPGDLGIRVAVPGLGGMDKTTAHSAILVILDTAMGERSAALDVQHTEVTDVPPDPASEGYMELPELTDYVAWRKKRFANPSA